MYSHFISHWECSLVFCPLFNEKAYMPPWFVAMLLQIRFLFLHFRFLSEQRTGIFFSAWFEISLSRSAEVCFLTGLPDCRSKVTQATLKWSPCGNRYIRDWHAHVCVCLHVCICVKYLLIYLSPILLHATSFNSHNREVNKYSKYK